jgi:hypothetical protein
MAGSDTTSPPLRAVLLSGDPILGARALRLCADGWRAVRVDSGYEAAAEILSAPVAALLIDLRSLGGLDRGLLALARRMEVQLAAIAGETPPDMTGDDLQGLRRIEIADIPAALAGARDLLASRVASAGESAGAAGVPEAPRESAADQPEPEPAPVPEPANEPAPAHALAPAQDAAPAPVPPQAEAPQAQPMRVTLTPKSGKPRTPAGMLTPDELAFLMEDEQ